MPRASPIPMQIGVAMELEKITPAEQKKTNRNNIYQFIHNAGNAAKKEIADYLHLSLPTVTQNLKELEAEGLIVKEGLYDSLCGRRAQVIACNPTAYVAIGVEVLKEETNLVAVDLLGQQLKTSSLRYRYVNEDSFYTFLGNQISIFADSLGIDQQRIIGVSIAIQGLISHDGQNIYYGMVSNNTGLNLSSFVRYIDFPCKIVHDAKASAFTEIWFRKMNDAIYIGLNHNVGGAAIVDGQIQRGIHSRAGAVEHMCIVPRGRPCYCGRRGCMETYCSADYLEQESGMNLDDFFTNLRSYNEKCNHIWKTYLNNLAFSIDNIRFILDSTIILGGTVASYMVEDDIKELYSLTQQANFCDIDILTGICNVFPSATGAALMLISDFIKSI